MFGPKSSSRVRLVKMETRYVIVLIAVLAMVYGQAEQQALPKTVAHERKTAVINDQANPPSNSSLEIDSDREVIIAGYVGNLLEDGATNQAFFSAVSVDDERVGALGLGAGLNKSAYYRGYGGYGGYPYH